MKRIFAAILIILLMFSFVPQNVEAATKGTLYSPVNLGGAGSAKTTWKNWRDSFYVSFQMKKQGYATISTSKVFNSRGNLLTYEYNLYDKNGKLMWDCMTDGQENIPNAKNINRVGLKKGKYILQIKPRHFYSTDAGLKTSVSVKTVSNAYWEIEGNDSFEKATTFKVNKTYTAVYGDNNNADVDYYKVKLTKGKKYRFKISNYDELFSNTAICNIYDPNKNEVKEYNSYSAAGSILERNGSVYIKANKTGYFYIKLWNDWGHRNPGAQFKVTIKKVG